jgi:integrase
MVCTGTPGRRSGASPTVAKTGAGITAPPVSATASRPERNGRSFWARLAQGLAPDANLARWPVSKLAERWLAERKVTVSPRTYHMDVQVLKPVLAALGAKRADEITVALLRDYRTRRLGQVAPGRSHPPQAYAVNREIQRLSCLLKDAKVWRRLREDYKPLRQQKSVVGREIPREQLQALFEAAFAKPEWQRLGCCALLALNTGMRGEEIKNLQLGRIEHGERPAVIISIQPLRPDGAPSDGRRGTKTVAGERRVPLNANAQRALSQLLAAAEALGATKPWHYLLPAHLSRHTKKLDPLCGKKGYDVTRPQQSWGSAWESLGREIKRRTGMAFNHPFHNLRHTFITWCGRAGVPIEKIMAMVGHMSKEMTRYYLHLNDADTRQVVDLVAEQSPKTPGRTG